MPRRRRRRRAGAGPRRRLQRAGRATPASTAPSCTSDALRGDRTPSDVAACCGRVRRRSPPASPGTTSSRATVDERLVGRRGALRHPGLVGATPIQNVGAYGQEVSPDHRPRAGLRPAASGGSSPAAPSTATSATGSSLFKADPGPLRRAQRQLPVPARAACRRRSATPNWPARSASSPASRAPLAEVREAVLELRRGKGMVLDAADHDTWSAGSFFTNPLLSAEQAAARCPTDAPRYPQPDGTVKTSAAWLIEHAGFSQRLRHPAWPRLSTKHTLALTNRGGATAADLLALAREVRDGVERGVRRPAGARAGPRRARASTRLRRALDWRAACERKNREHPVEHPVGAARPDPRPHRGVRRRRPSRAR